MLPLKFRNLSVTTRCDLNCGNCELWSSEPVTATMESLRDRATTKLINLCGGNPLLHAETPHLLQTLKARNHFVSVTTNGLHFERIDPQLLTLIDLPIIYFPAFPRADLRETSGFDCLKYYENTFHFLNDYKKKAIIHVPVTAALIPQLPELAEYCTPKNKLFLWLSYRSSVDNQLTGEEKTALQYYQSRKRSFVYLSAEKTTTLCQGCFTELELLRLKNILFFTQAFSKMYW